MLCQDCKERSATVHFTHIVNNEKTVLSLCKECAAKRGFHSPLDNNIPFPLAEILDGFIKQQFPEKGKTPMPDLKCPGCGLTFEKFAAKGRFGCGECYNTFRARLATIMRKIHGSSLHKGKLPSGSDEKDSPVMEEERLEEELKKAIDTEDFERAADLRDKLKDLRDKNLVAEDTK